MYTNKSRIYSVAGGFSPSNSFSENPGSGKVLLYLTGRSGSWYDNLAFEFEKLMFPCGLSDFLYYNWTCSN
jgi:hypothetical protein